MVFSTESDCWKGSRLRRTAVVDNDAEVFQRHDLCRKQKVRSESGNRTPWPYKGLERTSDLGGNLFWEVILKR